MLSADDSQQENSSTAPRRVLPKWPFFVGDAVLVIAALAIWSSSDGLSTAQLFFCLGAVGLGAIIFVAPYALKHLISNPENSLTGESADSDPSGSTPGNENEWRRQARLAAEAVEHAARANAALESSARRFDARCAPLVEIQQSLATVVAELREATAARASSESGDVLTVQREFERLRREQAEKFKATEEKIAILGDNLAVLAGHLKSTPPRPVEAPARAKASIAAHIQEPVAEPTPVLAGVAVLESPAPSEKPMAAVEVSSLAVAEAAAEENIVKPSLGSISTAMPVADHPTAMDAVSVEETSMLAKALARAQSSRQTPAVAGIIMARARRPKKSRAPIPVVAAAPAIADEPVPAPISESVATPANAVEREGWESLTEGKFDAVTVGETPPAEAIDQADPLPPPAKIEEPAPGNTSSAFRRSVRAKVIALRGEDEEATLKNTPVVFAPGRSENVLPQASDGPTQGELLAREAETIRKRRSSRSPIHASMLTARVLIGIGNKPFVRGTGLGLSSEKGVPMEFVEIGQWRWVSPGVIKEPITLRILKNDEIPAEGEAIVLHPGQSLDISPTFAT